MGMSHHRSLVFAGKPHPLGRRQECDLKVAASFAGRSTLAVIAMPFALATTLCMAIPNYRLLLRMEFLLLKIIFAMINACLQEGYWHGLSMDAVESWLGWLATLYAGSLSANNHL